MRRSVLAWVGALLLLGSPLASTAAAAGASITALGWWSQRPGASEQPSGGFEIALSLNGPVSQAALRIQVDSVQLDNALLRLTETQAAGAEVAAISVCPTTDAWTAENPGSWGDAPSPNCARNVPLSRSFSGEWSGDIGSLLSVGTVSVVLVPMSHPDTQGAPIPYQLTFSGATLLTSAPEAPTPPPTPPPTATSPPAAAPATAAPVAPSRPTTTEVPIGSPEAPVDPAEPIPQRELPTEEDDGTSRPWWRLAILLPLAALVGGGAVIARRIANDRGLLSSS